MSRLFWKIFIFTILVQIIATLGIGGTLWLKHFSHHTTSAQLDQSPPAAFRIKAAAATLQFGGSAALQTLLSDGEPHHPIFAVSDDDKEILHRNISSEVLHQARLLTTSDQETTAREVISKEGAHYLLFSAVFDADASPLPREINLQGESPSHAGQHPGPPPNDFFRPYLPIGSAIFCSLLSAALLAWYFSTPINQLRNAFEEVANGNLTTNLSSTMGTRRDELNDLGRDFDAMVKRLEILLDGQRRLLHDVSHELRSPLARLQVAIGLVRQQPEKIDTSLTRIEQECARMDKLVEELLTLSKLEAGAQTPREEIVDIDELMADVIEDARFEAHATDQTITFIGNCNGVVTGDTELLHRALENVIRNALKHSKNNHPVNITSAEDTLTHCWQVTVCDRGPGIPEAELETIFEPFFRCTQTNQNTGHGLGLAITRRIIEAHHGSITATNRPDGGLMVEIKLPLSLKKSDKNIA
ncbi:ATP-binding protein [Undibacterium sp. RuRC25W]|uniref:ATP-binding protein n=1 Tax=Undibacterium sp. RuRC25W TaxID=3413047 RepID=UPI003BEF80A4